MVDNAGYISASATGILIQGGGTVTESGTIIGGAISFNSAFSTSNRLILSPTATIIGSVQLNGAALECAATGTVVGSFAPESQQFLNAGSITIDAGANWDLTGTFTNGSAGTLLNDGTLLEGKKDLISINGPVIGAGVIELGAKPFTLNGAVAATQKIAFSGTFETLALGEPGQFAGTIETFSKEDTIHLSGIALTHIKSEKFVAGVLTIKATTGTYKMSFASPGSFKNETFALFADGPGTGITLSAATAVYLQEAAVGHSKNPASMANSGWLAHDITRAQPPILVATTL